MIQLLYISTMVGEADLDLILGTSRLNNLVHGITGLLYTDGRRFLQVLEGPTVAVDATYARIERDARHRAPVMLSRRDVEKREFGHWAMAARGRGEEGDAFLARVATLSFGASPDIQATFDGLARLRRAA